MYIAALVFEFYNSISTNKINCTYHEMQAAKAALLHYIGRFFKESIFLYIG